VTVDVAFFSEPSCLMSTDRASIGFPISSRSGCH